MAYVIWATIVAVIWTNNEILTMRMEKKEKPTYNFWISVGFTAFAIILWIILRCINIT